LLDKKVITDRKNVFVVGEKEPLISLWNLIQWEIKFL
jgi:hypothetical protein